MNRLTRRNPDGTANFADVDLETICYDLSVSECETVRAALEKLAAYEDAEQSGQRMCHIDALHTRAYEVFESKSHLFSALCQSNPAVGCSGGIYAGEDVPPCAYFCLDSNGNSYCTLPNQYGSKYRIRSIFVDGDDILKIGKTVFLTAKEAEAALKAKEV